MGKKVHKRGDVVTLKKEVVGPNRGEKCVEEKRKASL